MTDSNARQLDGACELGHVGSGSELDARLSHRTNLLIVISGSGSGGWTGSWRRWCHRRPALQRVAFRQACGELGLLRSVAFAAAAAGWMDAVKVHRRSNRALDGRAAPTPCNVGVRKASGATANAASRLFRADGERCAVGE